MTNKLLLFLFAICMVTNGKAQQADPVALTINGKPIALSEVKRAYAKSLSLTETKSKKQSFNQFVEGYIEFQRNVAEAKYQKIDTTASYKREYTSTRLQLMGTYLRDTLVAEQVIHQIYDRTQQDVEINHVLIPFAQAKIFPADTLIAYTEALKIRDELSRNNFTGPGYIDNTTTTNIVMDIESLKGYMGWVTAFMFSPAVEDAIYSLPLHQISMPIRTTKGYHLVQVLGKRPTIRAVEVQQVVLSFPSIPPTTHQIDSVRTIVDKIYTQMDSQGGFDSLCKSFAKAQGTEEEGCSFAPIFLDSKLPASFRTAAFNLQEIGEISKPILSDYGFHIIRLTDKKYGLPLDAIKRGLYEHIYSSDRSIYLSKAREAQLANNFHLVINQEAYEQLSTLANNFFPLDSLFLTSIPNEKEILFSIDGKEEYKVSDFVNELAMQAQQAAARKNGLETIETRDLFSYNLSTDVLTNLFSRFFFAKLYAYSEATLEARYPTFNTTMIDYAEATLFFDVKNKNVWQKAQTDEAELAAYFAKNKKDFTWNETRYKGEIIHCRSQLALAQVEELISQATAKDDIKQLIWQSSTIRSSDVQVEQGVWQADENPFVSKKIKDGDTPTPVKGYPYTVVNVRPITAPETYNDVRSQVNFALDSKLDKEWNAYLTKKYKVERKQSVLNTIK